MKENSASDGNFLDYSYVDRCIRSHHIKINLQLYKLQLYKSLKFQGKSLLINFPLKSFKKFFSKREVNKIQSEMFRKVCSCPRLWSLVLFSVLIAIAPIEFFCAWYHWAVLQYSSMCFPLYLYVEKQNIKWNFFLLWTTQLNSDFLEKG
jgi:hypothetical protein